MKKSVWFMLYLTLLLLSPGVSADTVPKYSQYSVASVYAGKAAPVSLNTKNKRMFRTRLRESTQNPVDFAGEYTVTTWGCGTSCVMGAVVSKKTGNVVWLPGSICCWEGSDDMLQYRKNSRLLVIGGMINEEGVYGSHFYEFTGKKFKRIKTVPLPSSHH
ncbi:MAG: hypothetical protein HZT40_21070 [Candidatus Thiothrix singaporensis]|uniref:Uncharacterized protein n=1 Tax=Candidatus Thiothrix singaporensis TaxID=2799669 RepID=A0A7L6AWY2_9GAMM|nr:MAG: hypothetical protein HZT40_21070 [Candidatus Thiothrix singaporensis]